MCSDAHSITLNIEPLYWNNINSYYYVRPSVYKCYDLLSSNDKTYLYNHACYAKEALLIRNTSDFITIH